VLGSVIIFLSIVSASPKDRAESKKCRYEISILSSDLAPAESFGVVELKSKTLLLLSPWQDPRGSHHGWKESRFVLLNEAGDVESRIVVEHEFENESLPSIYLWPTSKQSRGPNRLVFQSSKSPFLYVVELEQGQTGVLKGRLMEMAEAVQFWIFIKTKLGRDAEIPLKWNNSIHTLPSSVWAGLGKKKFRAQVSPDSKRIYSRLEISSADGVIQKDFYGTRFSGLIAYEASGRRDPNVILFQKSPFEGPSEHLLSRIHPSMRDDRWKYSRTRLMGVFGDEIKVGYQPKGLIEWAHLAELNGSTVLVMYERSIKNLRSDDKLSGDKVMILSLDDFSVISENKFDGDLDALLYLRDLHGLLRAFQAGILLRH